MEILNKMKIKEYIDSKINEEIKKRLDEQKITSMKEVVKYLNDGYVVKYMYNIGGGG